MTDIPEEDLQGWLPHPKLEFGGTRWHPLLDHFDMRHLTHAQRKIAIPFESAAADIPYLLPCNEESLTALRKLLEAMDCALRAARGRAVGAPSPAKPQIVIEERGDRDGYCVYLVTLGEVILRGFESRPSNAEMYASDPMGEALQFAEQLASAMHWPAPILHHAERRQA